MDRELKSTELHLDGERKTTVYYVGTGPIVLYVHGWAHGSSRWRRFQMSTKTPFTHVSIDLPGFAAASDQLVERPYLDFYEAFLSRLTSALCRHFDQPLEAIVAHSLGGCAAAYALQKPSAEMPRPNKLILLDTPLDGNLLLKLLTIAYPIVLITFLLRRLVPRFVAAFFARMTGFLTTRKWSAMDECFVVDALEPRTFLLTNTLFAVAFMRVPLEAIPNVAKGIWFVRGRSDWVMTSRAMQSFAAAWNANTHVFDGATHTPFMEAPDEFDSWLESILIAS